MLEPIVRSRKIVRDIALAPGRTVAMVVAVAVGGVAVGSSLGAYAVLSREIQRSYLETVPASATLQLEERTTASLVEAVRNHPGVAEADARATILAQVDVGATRHPMLLFAVDDFDDMRVALVFPEIGAREPPLGTMLVERSALCVLAARMGDAPLVSMPGGGSRHLAISGVVHDPGLAPAWMEQAGYGYITPETLVWLGATSGLNELRVVFDGDGVDREPTEARAAELGTRSARHVIVGERHRPGRRHERHVGKQRARCDGPIAGEISGRAGGGVDRERVGRVCRRCVSGGGVESGWRRRASEDDYWRESERHRLAAVRFIRSLACTGRDTSHDHMRLPARRLRSLPRCDREGHATRCRVGGAHDSGRWTAVRRR